MQRCEGSRAQRARRRASSSSPAASSAGTRRCGSQLFAVDSGLRLGERRRRRAHPIEPVRRLSGSPARSTSRARTGMTVLVVEAESLASRMARPRRCRADGCRLQGGRAPAPRPVASRAAACRRNSTSGRTEQEIARRDRVMYDRTGEKARFFPRRMPPWRSGRSASSAWGRWARGSRRCASGGLRDRRARGRATSGASARAGRSTTTSRARSRRASCGQRTATPRSAGSAHDRARGPRRLRPRHRGHLRGPGRRTRCCASSIGAPTAGRDPGHEHLGAVGHGDRRGDARPERVVGMHFFNPAPADAARRDRPRAAHRRGAFESAYAFAEQAGKEPIRCNDTPGFVVNRILIPLLNDCVRVLDEAGVSPEDLDKAMRFGAGGRWARRRSSTSSGSTSTCTRPRRCGRACASRGWPPRRGSWRWRGREARPQERRGLLPVRRG